MKRTWLARPDVAIDTLIPVEGGHVPGDPVHAVSHQALAQAVLDGVTLLHRAGGQLTVMVQRVPTGVPGERVTSAAAVEWRDHPNTRDQPERDGPAIQIAAEEDRPSDPSPTQPEPDDLTADEQDAVSLDRTGELVDESDIPVALRGS